ncbi:SWIM zinc finger family protein [Acidipropionibacterium virtanenii]|uniref:SWIM-type domain-containing protein n=1 Tax=Acidipropionibacterium virtanenii TaxID=2057246 RepID=A0A344UT57_9ACTN|nr:SWIM zinc finger family protein [Acidipropionibacterium virtanenii]AXE38455.1 hypothetical protein JS278_01279 [Acidipropionibacterium virtanenii]
MRDDLVALDEDALSALTNRGLVKRARRLADAPRTRCRVDAGGVVTADFDDGATAVIDASGLEGARCTCAATGMCRHILAAVLAHRGLPPSPTSPIGSPPRRISWTPASVGDEELVRRYGTAVLEAARARIASGLVAVVLRPDPSSPAVGANAAAVELPATVRFLVPGDLGAAHTDVNPEARAEHIAVAALAWREADRTDRSSRRVEMSLGAALGTNARTDELTGIADCILIDGVRQSAATLAPMLAAARSRLDRAGLRWAVAVADDLSEQLSGYATGHSGYSRRRTAELLAEGHARARAARTLGAAAVLGAGIAATTPMRRVRLVGLGARVSRSDDDGFRTEGPVAVTTDIFLGDVDSAVVVVLRARSHQPAGEPPRSTVGNRTGGVLIGDLARGCLVTESAARSADRMLSLTSNRVARTTVTTPPAIWSQALPPGLLVDDYARALDQLAARGFRLVRPRVAAESVRVVEIDEVGPIGYRPGAQLLTADVFDRAGHRATVAARYRPACPSGLDALASALASGPRMISGVLGRRSGRLLIDPLAVATPAGVVVPDLAEGGDADPLQLGAPDPGDGLDQTLREVAGLLADAAHAGLRHVGGAFPGRVGGACERLHRVGLHRLADDLDGLLSGGSARNPADAWVRAELRLLATVDAR